MPHGMLALLAGVWPAVVLCHRVVGVCCNCVCSLWEHCSVDWQTCGRAGLGLCWILLWYVVLAQMWQ